MRKKVISIFIVLSAFLMVSNYSFVMAKENNTVELISWEKVNAIIPKYTKFTVMDLETGKEFKVQRRAGSQHADVQPLTTDDTKIMKSIYDGKWSWKRRAIIVKYDGRRIAASMHGMPHGAGALKNNFPGHFCIHFYGSKTHRKNFMDLSHKLMILKAAGELEKYLENANPYEAVRVYIAGLKQQDKVIVNNITLQKQQWEKILPTIENVGINSMAELPAEDLEGELSIKVPVQIDWFISDRGKEKYNGEIHLIRFTPYGQWLVDSESFLKETNLIDN